MTNKKILAVSAHPDDETLGCGGTLLKLKDEGFILYWLIISNIFESQGYSLKQIIKRQKEIDKVSKLYGFKKTFKLDFFTTELDAYPLREIINKVSKVLTEVAPREIYLPNRSDAHSDHRVTFDAVISGAKSFRCSAVKRILMYETISETEFSPPLPENHFIPNAYSDITSYIEQKIKIMKLYAREMGQPPFPRSEQNIRALATWRGGVIGAKFAESFMLLKEIF